MVHLLNRIGFSYKKTTEVPCEANAEVQEDFVQMIKTRFDAKKEGDIYIMLTIRIRLTRHVPLMPGYGKANP